MTTTQQQGPETTATDHRGLGVLDHRECLRRIASTPIGRIAFHDAGETVILPVNHVVDGSSIAFRARWDSVLASAVNQTSVAFEVDEFDALEGTGWSVLVRGVASTVYDEETSRRFEDRLGDQWGEQPEGTFWTSIRPDEVSGREMKATRGECGCC
ncbi:pyridoxamine 5'-phosphate oxidase family protein [Janibacter cremeus]|uniref:Nitroimidazol reductase NimA-like FMN-containing flavoprotein (Pyridoxamine 5'-phosphate oxidase superfamily) n=1 Tax=Janibacter cremeus TaxID=1285192 RepID=A0A852VMB8_9MICO|nr:pyridoxamine 5'-phosphate oxidase family protein [Janibacter cremeus]NYF98172.1 nitroimidazol reductase NimA-like FMN-containing flavoprotein (pyridoxamine 5'-phosphate oxidase superfamily) [Janibacter cremeus]